jgi:NodT family efflux transporter outer membrane factor (OMF) lipoprotein
MQYKAKKNIIIASCFYIAIILVTSCVPLPKKDHLYEINTAKEIDPFIDKAIKEKIVVEKESQKNDSWWDIYNDDTLNSMITIALENNPTMKTAKARIELALETANATRSKLLPELNGAIKDSYKHLSQNGFFSHTIFGKDINEVKLALDFQYEFDIWGKNKEAYMAKLSKEKAQIAELSQTNLIISIAVAKSYKTLQSYKQQLKLLEEILLQKHYSYDLINFRFVSGIDTKIEEEEAKAQIFELEKSIFGLTKEISIEKTTLKVLMGLGPSDETEKILPNNNNVTPISLPKDLPLDLISRRPDIMAQIWRVESYAYEIGVAKKDFYPNINLLSLAGIDSLKIEKLLSAKSFFATVTPSLHLPIFTGGRLTAVLGTKIAGYNIAVSNYNDMLLQATKEVADAITSLLSLKNQVQADDNTLLCLIKTYELQSSRFINGITTNLDVIRSNEKQLSQQYYLTITSHLYDIAVLQLIKSIGGGFCYSKDEAIPQKINNMKE